MPDRPQQADGMRMDPPPSEPVARGTMPAASAAPRSARRPAGAVVELPGVARRPEEGVGRVGAPGELRGVRLADHDAPGGTQPGDVGESAEARGASASSREPWVVRYPAVSSRSFTAEGDAGQGSRVATGRDELVDRRRLLEGTFAVDRDECVDPGSCSSICARACSASSRAAYAPDLTWPASSTTGMRLKSTALGYHGTAQLARPGSVRHTRRRASRGRTRGWTCR